VGVSGRINSFGVDPFIVQMGNESSVCQPSKLFDPKGNKIHAKCFRSASESVSSSTVGREKTGSVYRHLQLSSYAVGICFTYATYTEHLAIGSERQCNVDKKRLTIESLYSSKSSLKSTNGTYMIITR
jgi:hypothetical protein